MKKLLNPSWRDRNPQPLSSRGSGSDRGDPGVKQSHVEGNDGLPRSLCELAMTIVFQPFLL